MVVDAANVIGSRADGWWRDRAGAARRLLAQVESALAAGTLAGPVTVVLEGRARPAADAVTPPDLRVVEAPAGGDDRIVEVAAAGLDGGSAVTVITADRALAHRVRALGAAVGAPSAFLSALESPPPGPVSGAR